MWQNIWLIVLGWFLGIFSPLIVDSARAYWRRRQFLKSLHAELRQLQIRLLFSGYMIAQRFGSLDPDYLVWLRTTMLNYREDELVQKTLPIVDSFIDNGISSEVLQRLRAKEGKGIGVKTYTASYLDSNLAELIDLPERVQFNVHRFRDSLDLLNQEIEFALKIHVMTFDGSISNENHRRLIADIDDRYANLQRMTTTVSKNIEAILSDQR